MIHHILPCISHDTLSCAAWCQLRFISRSAPVAADLECAQVRAAGSPQ